MAVHLMRSGELQGAERRGFELVFKCFIPRRKWSRRVKPLFQNNRPFRNLSCSCSSVRMVALASARLHQRRCRALTSRSTLLAAKPSGEIMDESGRHMPQRSEIDAAGCLAPRALDFPLSWPGRERNGRGRRASFLTVSACWVDRGQATKALLFFVRTPPHFPNRVAASGEYRFEFAFIRSHSRDAFQNVSTQGFVVPAACLQVIVSVLGSVKTHLPVLCGLAGGPGEDGAVLLDIAILPLPR